MFANMDRHKVLGRSTTPQGKVKGITIKEGTTISKAKTTKHPTSCGTQKSKAKQPVSPEHSFKSDGI